MILRAVLALFIISIFWLTFLFLRNKARLKIRLLASLVASSIVSLVFVLLSFLTKSGYRLVLGVFSLVSLILLGVIECLLRILLRLEKKVSQPQESNGDDSQVKAAAFYSSFDEVKNLEAVVNDPTITEKFWAELMSYRIRGMFKRDKNQVIVGNADISGTNLNVVGGIRNTPGNPKSDSPRCLIFGASGVFSYEVPDSRTPTAWLQSFMNESFYSYKVENHGVGGATIQDCFRRIKTINLVRGDIAVFVFGGNDVGVNTTKKIQGKGIFGRVPFWGVTLKAIMRHSAVVEMLFLKTTELIYTDIESNPEVLSRVEDTFTELANHLKKIDVAMLFVLQPNLFTKKFHNDYEKTLIAKYPKHWGNTILAGYKVLKTQFKNNPHVIFATHIFDDELVSPFLDWGHVNSTGNKIIAQHLFESLKERRIISK